MTGYIATRPIDLGTARAYNPGDPVADDVVKNYGLEDSVAKAGTKAAAQAVEPDTAPPATSK